MAVDVYNSINQFFFSRLDFPQLKFKLIVLIPKLKGADSIDSFRPISLANFQFKLITKVLAGRLANVAPKIISQHQRGFFRDRQIGDCICITSEAVNMLHNRSFGGKYCIENRH